MADAHRKYGLAAERDIAFEKNLLEIAKRWAHARDPLAELNEAIFYQLVR